MSDCIALQTPLQGERGEEGGGRKDGALLATVRAARCARRAWRGARRCRCSGPTAKRREQRAGHGFCGLMPWPHGTASDPHAVPCQPRGTALWHGPGLPFSTTTSLSRWDTISWTGLPRAARNANARTGSHSVVLLPRGRNCNAQATLYVYGRVRF